jgi:hypothetical protein
MKWRRKNLVLPDRDDAPAKFPLGGRQLEFKDHREAVDHAQAGDKPVRIAVLVAIALVILVIWALVGK